MHSIFQLQCYSSLKVTLPCRKPALVGFYSSIMQGNVWGEVTSAREKQATAAPQWTWDTHESCRLSCCLACPLSGGVPRRTKRRWVKPHHARQSLVLEADRGLCALSSPAVMLHACFASPRLAASCSPSGHTECLVFFLKLLSERHFYKKIHTGPFQFGPVLQHIFWPQNLLENLKY